MYIDLIILFIRFFFFFCFYYIFSLKSHVKVSVASMQPLWLYSFFLSAKEVTFCSEHTLFYVIIFSTMNVYFQGIVKLFIFFNFEYRYCEKLHLAISRTKANSNTTQSILLLVCQTSFRLQISEQTRCFSRCFITTNSVRIFDFSVKQLYDA